MSEKPSLRQRWDEFRPSKTTLFWSVAAGAVATMVIGFSWGGWVTGGTAQAIAEKSAQQAHQDLAAAICTERFTGAPEARAQLAELKEITSAYQRGKFVEDRGWALMPGASSADRKTAVACAEGLITLELPPLEEASEISDDATVAR
jgi:hypothetical protein